MLENSQIMDQSSQNKIKNICLIIIIIIILISVSLLAFNFYQNFKKKSDTNNTTSSKTEETENWKTFNTDIWLVKYPSTWIAQTYSEPSPFQDFYPQNRIGNYPNLNILGSNRNTVEKAKQYAESTYNYDKKSIDNNIVEKETTVDGKAAKMFNGTSNKEVSQEGLEVEGTIQVSLIIFQDENNVAEIYFTYEAENRDKTLDDLFEKIASSFRFTN